MQKGGRANYVCDDVDGSVTRSGNWMAAAVGIGRIGSGRLRGVVVFNVVNETNIGRRGAQEFEKSGVLGGAKLPSKGQRVAHALNLGTRREAPLGDSLFDTALVFGGFGVNCGFGLA